MKDIEAFLGKWQADNLHIKEIFLQIVALLDTMENITLIPLIRENVSVSIRAKHNAQTERSAFAFIDIIDDEPKNRWLSVCFYEDMITDADSLGDLVPGGLSGEDGYCFDVSEADEAPYVLARIQEAYENAEKI